MRRLPALLAVVTFALTGCASPPGVRTGRELAIRNRADAAYAKGDSATALAAYRQLADAGLNDALVWTRIGNLELLQNQPRRAADAYAKAVQLDPEDTDAWHNMAIIRLRQAAAMLDRERASLQPGDPRAGKIRCEQARLDAVLHPADLHADKPADKPQEDCGP